MTQNRLKMSHPQDILAPVGPCHHVLDGEVRERPNRAVSKTAKYRLSYPLLSMPFIVSIPCAYKRLCCVWRVASFRPLTAPLFAREPPLPAICVPTGNAPTPLVPTAIDARCRNSTPNCSRNAFPLPCSAVAYVPLSPCKSLPLVFRQA